MTSLVFAFNELNKNIKKSGIEKCVRDIINEADKTKNPEIIRDLFTLIFHKRNCHIGGEGYRHISYLLLLEVYKYYPSTICQMIDILPLYGCYKDYFEIWKLICKMKLTDSERYDTYNPLITSILLAIKKQINSDMKEEKISLLAKWMPREGTHYDKQCFWYSLYYKNEKEVKEVKEEKEDKEEKETVKSLKVYNAVFYLAYIINNKFSHIHTKKSTNVVLMKYRKMISSITKKLNVPEVMMCANKYSEIEFNKINYKSMNKYTKSFLNEKSFKDMNTEHTMALLNSEPLPIILDIVDHPGDRFPNKEDRIITRVNLINQIKDGSLNLCGKYISLESVIDCLNGDFTTKAIKEVLKLEWKKKKESIKEEENNTGNHINLFNCIPMIDVSDSMRVEKYNSNNVNFNIAMGYGLMASELQTPTSKQTQYAISFTSPPSIIEFNVEDDIEIRQNKIIEVSSKKNYMTQFGKAIDLILDICIKNEITNDDVPNLFVLTDNTFDFMNINEDENIPSKKWIEIYQELKAKWNDAGYDRIPMINYWNITYDGNNKPSITEFMDYPGIQMIRGFSNVLSKYILYGNDKFISSITPYERFRQAIDQEIYKPVYQAVINSTEKLLNYKYNF